MLSLHQAIEIKESIIAYLKATFTFQNKAEHKAFYDFILHPVNGMFKGPYLSLNTPFAKADSNEMESIPLVIKPTWPPYDHQVKAWHRLSTRETTPRPTIITTGTGSGKTESFIYPLLDYCYLNSHRRGIKAIILYPMNALATDQAKRLAETIASDPRLTGKITAGLFIGEGHNKSKYPVSMGPSNVIENRNAILESPPDILLTNFKMLDYGLLKANFHTLWHYNFTDNNLLRFLVLDELHTYDGAQGTDVANLIRRLKLKLNLPQGGLCPVGTSATIGSGDEAPALLADYASKVFGETIDTSAIIAENRILPEDYFSADDTLEDYLPRSTKLHETVFRQHETYSGFIMRQADIWQLDIKQLANHLRQQRIVKDLVIACRQLGGSGSIDQIEQRLSMTNVLFRQTPQWDAERNFSPKRAVLESLLALIAEAKQDEERRPPFLYMQAQLWIRELSGLQRLVANHPVFVWKEHVDDADKTKALPPWFCRDCGTSGWLAVKHDAKEQLQTDVNDTYNKFFSHHANLFFLLPTGQLSTSDFVESGYAPSVAEHWPIVPTTLKFDNKHDKTETVKVLAVQKMGTNQHTEHVCPACNAKNTVSIIGTKIATLSSIAISQTLSTDLDPTIEKNRKVLAFTNSVQDAAHQAGFVEARNYRFTLRSSIQKVINITPEACTLNQLADKFITYWKQHAGDESDKHQHAYYYRFYPKDYAGKSSPDIYFSNGRYSEHFKKEFDLRLRWEIYAEFGYDAVIGRTLEKTGTSAVRFDNQTLLQVWAHMQPWLTNNQMDAFINKETFIPFLWLMLQRIRTRGAVSHPFLEKFRSESLNLWDLNWNKDTRHFLQKGFGPRSRLPKLLTTQPERRGILDSTHTQTGNWFHSYLKKCFPLLPYHIDLANELYSHLVEAMKQSGLIDERVADGVKNYALSSSAIIVEPHVSIMECDKCGHTIYTSEKELTAPGGHCTFNRCTGIYRTNGYHNEPNYYQAVYNRNRSPRIYAAEHTGLLGRKEHEVLERDFKYRPTYKSKNTLLATSTLEMGIDIGDLNTAFNNNVPPLPSNFLQRVGRAGRKEGSALIVNFAKHQAHDLFYFSQPKDMMAGEIATPGCYLEAKEILRRHFFAFCIDTWTMTAPQTNIIPGRIKFLKLKDANLTDESFFLNRIVAFVQAQEKQLFKRFKEQYGQVIHEGAFEQLNESLTTSQFYLFNMAIFEKLQADLRQLQLKREELKAMLNLMNLGQADPHRLEIESEIKNLHGIIIGIGQRQTLEQLTNMGALPNYAFPETGVTLMAKVLGTKATGSDKAIIDKNFELVRPAAQAITELAPENFFYSQGYRFQISGINTYDWADALHFHKKRFCSQCDHIETDSSAPKGACPKCGHASWQSSANTHSYARLLTVKSISQSSSATLDDLNDDRESENYRTMSHFNFDTKSSLGAWALKDIPFGIEFVKNVTICTTNMGKMDISDARKIKISDTEVPHRGFVTCRYCGKSSSAIKNNEHKFHYGYCKHASNIYNGKSDDVFEEVFLFREMCTEALKIILPVQEFNSEAEIKMFKAGIELGLKKYYKGNPQHIAIEEYKEYNQRTQKFDRYLVLYDKVPGGTGYLQQLFNRNEFTKLLSEAHKAIRDCQCRHEGRDGCYRCIYSYGNQYYRHELSREKAEKWFSDIVSKTDGWELQSGGLNDVTSSGKIEESELEERFIALLKRMASQREEWTFTETNQDGTVCYWLCFNKDQTAVDYFIRPQVNLGPSKGVALHTRTDFLMTCTRALINETDHRESIKHKAIYLDGFQFHASNSHNRFMNDLEKRLAIRNSQEYNSWTITWDDLDLFAATLEKTIDMDALAKRLAEPSAVAIKSKLQLAYKHQLMDFTLANNNIERLLTILQNPVTDESSHRSWTFYWSLFQRDFFKPSFPPEMFNIAYSEQFAQQAHCLTHRTLDALIPVHIADENPLFEWRTLVNLHRFQVFGKTVIKNISEINKGDWNLFWNCYNLLQASPIEFVESFSESAPVNVANKLEAHYPIEELLPFYDECYHEILLQMNQKGWINCEDDEIGLNSLLDQNGNPIAEAELIVHKQLIVFEPLGDEARKTFKKQGYTIKTKADSASLN